MTIEMVYIQHCDLPECALGTAEWDCPGCGGHNVEYGEFFYEEYEKEHEGVLCCDKCKAEYKVKKENYEHYKVIEDEQLESNKDEH